MGAFFWLRISSIILSVLPFCFLYPFLGFPRSHHPGHKLIKIWQPRVIGPSKESKLFKKLLESSLGLGNPLAMAPSSVFD